MPLLDLFAKNCISNYNSKKVPGNNVFTLFPGTLARKERFELSLAF